MSTQLTTTSYVVLAGVAASGSATPYELKGMVSELVGHFWSFPHSQLYSESARLAREGLLSETREQGGRRRRRFEVTDEGRDRLSEWLQEPTDELPEIRDLALLKLFFSFLGRGQGVQDLATVQAAEHRARVEQYETLSRELPRGSIATALQLGLAWERVAADFWAGVADRGLDLEVEET